MSQIYWLADFGDVSCLLFNYLRVETLIPTWEDLVGHLSDNLVGHLHSEHGLNIAENSEQIHFSLNFSFSLLNQYILFHFH
jgi:hypothetical protein